MKKNRVLWLVVVVLMAAFAFTGCAPAQTPVSEETKAPSTQESSPEVADEETKAEESPVVKVGIAMKTLDNPYFIVLADTLKALCEERGWEVTLLDAKNDISEEVKNIETLNSLNMDLVFLDSIDSVSCIPAIKEGKAAGIPTIVVDSGIDESSGAAVCVMCAHKDNGVEVGKYCAKTFGDEEIVAAQLTGTKGHPYGQMRRAGIYAGIMAVRLGLSDEDAYERALVFDQQLTDTGKARDEEAKLTITGQGFGGWTADGGLPAMEDLLVANPNINAVFGENDNMLLGAMTALKNAGKLEDVSIFASADGQKEAYELIMNNTSYKATGENDPEKIALKAVDFAKQIIEDGVDPYSFDLYQTTEAICVSIENVDKFYDENSAF